MSSTTVITTGSTAIILDLQHPSSQARQVVIVAEPDKPGRYTVLSRHLTSTATAKHWKRWPVDSASIDGTPEAWLTSYVNMHEARGFAPGAAFVVDVTPAELTELAEDATPRALMIRIDRARNAIGADVFKAEPRYQTGDFTLASLLDEVTNWADPTTAVTIAPSGRARTPKTAPAAPTSAAVPVSAAEPVAAGSVVKPGDRCTLPDGTVYIARVIDGDLSDVEMLRKARGANAYALLYSLPGTGKTRSMQAAFGDDLITVIGTADTEVADLIGGYVPTAKAGEFRWIDGPLVHAMENGLPLLLDEAFLIDTRTMAIVYSAIDGRREVNVTANPARGVVKAKAGFWIGFASNPHVPGARVSEALLSRCTIQVEYTTDFAAMEKLGVPRPFVVAARNLDKKRVNQELSGSPQARECLAFKQTSDLFGELVALRNVVASAAEMDRDVVADVLSRTFGKPIAALRTS